MYTEFLASTIEACGRIEEDRIAEAFDRLDSDDTGFISKENLREVLGENSTEKEVNAIMSASDKDRDGKISYADFLATFREQTHSRVKQVTNEPSKSLHEA
jgi:Ca2+-binding EF-hand superfamily protein